MQSTRLFTRLSNLVRPTKSDVSTHGCSQRRSFIRKRYNSPFSTQCPRYNSIAAPEINLEELSSKHGSNVLETARIVPVSPSYFTARPRFTDDYVSLQALLRKHQLLPLAKPGQAPRVAWRTIQQYRDLVGEEVRSSRYTKILNLLNRLNYIHPSLLPEDVSTALQRYKRDIDPYLNKPKPRFIDRYGRAQGVGKRKSATAMVYLVEGEGEVLVNGKPLNLVFGRVHDRDSAVWALKATERLDKYNMWATVKGGGTTGQAEALALAVAKALMVHEPLLKPALRRSGCITRDPRKVERKKPGKLKARKMPAWVKR